AGAADGEGRLEGAAVGGDALREDAAVLLPHDQQRARTGIGDVGIRDGAGERRLEPGVVGQHRNPGDDALEEHARGAGGGAAAALPRPGRDEATPARRQPRAARKRAADVEHGYENGRADHVARRIVAARLDRQLAAVVAAPDDQEVSRRAEGDIGLVVTEVVHLAGGEERTEHLPSGVVALEEYGIAARYLDARTPGDG